MFGTNLITGPSLIGGILYGVNRRNQADYKHDVYAHYKLMSLTSFLGFLNIVAKSDFPVSKSSPGQIILSGLLGGVLMSGTTFCMGTMMTRIPGPFINHQDENEKGLKIKLF
jgi:hypothetical protein